MVKTLSIKGISVDVSDIFYLFYSGEFEVPGGEGGTAFYWNIPRGGGGFPGQVGGRVAGRVFVGIFWGGGLNIFFGAETPTKACICTVQQHGEPHFEATKLNCPIRLLAAGEPGRNYIGPPPPLISGQKAFSQGRGVEAVYFEATRQEFYTPPFYTPPTPGRVFSPGVLRSKDFFAPIFVVFSDFCKSYFWHPYFYRVFRDFRRFR